MADPADHRRAQEGAEEEPGKVAGHHQAQGPVIEAGLRPTHRQQGAEQPAAGQQQGNAEQE